MTESNNIALSIKNKQRYQPRNERLLKYKEPITYLSFSKRFTTPESSNYSNPGYKAFILEERANESIAQRDAFIEEAFIYLPTSLIFSKPSEISTKGHYYKYSKDKINNVYTIIYGLDFFNMDVLKKSIKTNIRTTKNDIFMVCSYDLFHKTDLRIIFTNDLQKYEILPMNHAEETVWEGVYISEFIRMFKDIDIQIHNSWVSYENDFLRMSDVKVEFQLFDVLIKYLPYGLKTGYDTSQGFKEVDYINNSMIKAIINFLELRRDRDVLVKILTNKLIDYLDIHEVYLFVYLALINHFKIEDEAFMHITNQAMNVYTDPYLIKQILVLQLTFFERSKEDEFICNCFKICKKLFQLSSGEAFIQLNLVKYLFLTNNLRYDLLEFGFIDDQVKYVHNPRTSSMSIKSYHFDYLLTEFSNPEIKEVENIKILTHNNIFYNMPDSKHGYLNFIWNNKETFADYVVDQNYFKLGNDDPDEENLFTMQMKLNNNNLVYSCIKPMLISNEDFLNYLLKIKFKKTSNNILNKFLVVYKDSLTFIKNNKIDSNMIKESADYKTMKLVLSSYYFLGMYQSCMKVAETLLDHKFDKFVLNLYLKALKNIESFDVLKVLQNIVVALSFENRFYDKVHLEITHFVKEELVNKRRLSTEYLINESIRSVDSFINEKLVIMIIDFYSNI